MAFAAHPDQSDILDFFWTFSGAQPCAPARMLATASAAAPNISVTYTPLYTMQHATSAVACPG